MSLTIPGLITVLGLLSAGYYIPGHDKRVCEIFSCFFLTFCCVNAAVHLDVGREVYRLMYAIPALFSAAVTLYLFWRDMDWRVYLLAGIYVFNVLAETFHLDLYKLVWSIDLLDILAWMQLALLVHLAYRAPRHGRSSRTRP